MHDGCVSTPAAPLVAAPDLISELAGGPAGTGGRPVVLDVRWRLVPPPEGRKPRRRPDPVGEPDFDAGHVPGAVFLDVDTDLAGPPGPAGRHPLPDPDDLQTTLRRAGIGRATPVVVHDGVGAGDAMAAARAWWVLRWAGLAPAQVRVLDGGFDAWTAAGGPTATESGGARRPGDIAIAAGAMPVLTADAAVDVAGRGVLLDARAPERFRGETEPIDPVAGHVPGAGQPPGRVPARRRRPLAVRRRAGHRAPRARRGHRAGRGVLRLGGQRDDARARRGDRRGAPAGGPGGALRRLVVELVRGEAAGRDRRVTGAASVASGPMRTTVVWDEALLAYKLSADHPLHPVRLDLTMRLARALGVLEDVEPLVPTPAPDEELERVHVASYLAAVRRAPEHGDDPAHQLGTADNPIFEGMHDAAALVSGGSIAAAREIAEGRADRAVNLAGGLHHAMRDHAWGFCIYNDCAIAISWLLDHGYTRIAYVDTDVHHGDGVQAAFLDDPRVMTISMHQHPRTLWPGTGFPSEFGEGAAAGHRDQRAAAARHPRPGVAARLPRRRALDAAGLRAADPRHPVRGRHPPRGPAGRALPHRRRPPGDLPGVP